jgi:hypothetical protein
MKEEWIGNKKKDQPEIGLMLNQKSVRSAINPAK